jgi:hypothetical protein
MTPISLGGVRVDKRIQLVRDVVGDWYARFKLNVAFSTGRAFARQLPSVGREKFVIASFRIRDPRTEIDIYCHQCRILSRTGSVSL